MFSRKQLNSGNGNKLYVKNTKLNSNFPSTSNLKICPINGNWKLRIFCNFLSSLSAPNSSVVRFKVKKNVAKSQLLSCSKYIWNINIYPTKCNNTGFGKNTLNLTSGYISIFEVKNNSNANYSHSTLFR